MSKKKIWTISIVAIFFFAFLLFHFEYRTSPARSTTSPNQVASVALVTQATTTDTYPVSRVIDGDTIVVTIHGIDEKIRLIGVNTPETVDPRKPVQCFGREASDFVKAMLPQGTLVKLESDPTQNDKDKYGRLLRYVYLGDVLVDEEIIQEGYGYEYTYDIPYEFQKEFKASQVYAKAGDLGLWSKATCGGKLTLTK